MPKLDDVTLQVLEGIHEDAGRANNGGDPVAVQEPAQQLLVREGTALDEIARYEPQTNAEGQTGFDSGLIFANEGLNLGRQHRRMTPQQARKLAEVARYYQRVCEGHISLQQLSETMMSSEFSNLLGQTLDRVLLAKYATYSPSYRAFLRRRLVRDFRSVSSVRRNTGGRLSEVRQGTNYPLEGLAEAAYTFAVAKYGKGYEITWEMIVNDDLEAFTSLPEDMAEDAIQTEMYLAAALYVANSTLFSTTHSHEGVNYSNKDTAALAIDALIAAFNTMVKYPGDADKPLMNQPVYLVIPPALQLKARQILGSMQIVWAGGDATTGATAVAHPTDNPVQGLLTVVIDPYIPILDPTNGHTSWYLFSDPRQIHGAEYAFLRGYEQPQMFMRNANSMRVGGGADVVDYDRDTRGYKVRHVFGGSHANAAGGWRACYWSDGTA